MASCFTNPNKKKLSAKDYIIKKRRSIIFCDIREKMLDKYSRGDFTNGGSNDACVDKDGIFTKYKNHKIQLDMLAAFEDFRTDLITTCFKDNYLKIISVLHTTLILIIQILEMVIRR